MQVMQTSELSKTEVLVGQASVTKNFGVSDDPMLMSMLSTGFYGNPLRTMIQEVMFNAWDAHRMGNCQDRPIDIYINRESGLIIRDYGPGIHDDDIHPIYCIYGGSTKRNDKGQTGGFGLGSKSPFAYTESFTVTSMHEGTKCMYLISRVSEDGGKPGLTRLIKTPVINDTGLMVTVNLKDDDFRQARRYVYSILFLSGIKARFHWMDDEPELHEAKSLAAGEYHLDRDQDAERNSIFAVYGGVRYQIPRHNDYTEEYNFLRTMAGSDNALYIGFAPDTLTPLPNREGLNMSDKSREAIRTGMELCLEQFRTIIEPLCEGYIAKAIEDMARDKIQPHFALAGCFRLGSQMSGTEMSRRSYINEIMDHPAEGCEPSLWKIVCGILKDRITSLVDIVGYDTWGRYIIRHFSRVYPDHKHLLFAVVKEKEKDSWYLAAQRYGRSEHLLQKKMAPTFNRDLYKFEKELKALYPDDELLHANLYVEYADVWSKVCHEKVRSKLCWSADKKREELRKSPKTVFDPSRLWFVKEGGEVDHTFMEKTIFLAKTFNTLRSTDFQVSKIFSTTGNRHPGQFTNRNNHVIIGAVVHSRKGAYDAAKTILQNQGWNVIEADEPEKRVVQKTVISEPTYPKLVLTVGGWASQDEAHQITDPTHFVYATLGMLNETDWRVYGQKPDADLVKMMCHLHPKTVMIHNKLTADKLEKQGVIPFPKAVEQWFDSLTTKKYRFRNIVRALKLIENSNIPQPMLKDPVIQKAMGMVVIEPDDTQAFWSEVSNYQVVLGARYDEMKDLVKKAKEIVETTWKADPLKTKITSYINQTEYLYESHLDRMWRHGNDSEKAALANKISRFIRDI